jgi:hypothetical protein
MVKIITGSFGKELKRYFQIILTLRKTTNFCIGNFICAQYRFMDGL